MKTVLVHPGKFHADDVFAVATLFIAFHEEWYIVRSQDPKDIEQADVVFDVGGEYDVARRRFDHHQTGGAGVRENGIPYASFGLAWKTYGTTAVAAYQAELSPDDLMKVVQAVDTKFVCALDAHDCGMALSASTHPSEIHPTTVSGMISMFNRTWRETEDAGSNADTVRRDSFVHAVEIAQKILERVIRSEIDRQIGEADVQQALEESKKHDSRVVILNAPRPWFDVVEADGGVEYCVYPSERGGWSAQAVRAHKGSMESKLPFPQAWRGKRDAELASVSGVASARFCHNAGFLVSADTKEGVLALVSASFISAGRPALIHTV